MLLGALNASLDTDIHLHDVQTPIDKAMSETGEIVGDTIAFFKDPTLENLLKVIRDYLFGPNTLIPGEPIVSIKGSKVPLTGLPLLELQNALEGTNRKLEGECLGDSRFAPSFTSAQPPLPAAPVNN